MKKIRPDYDAKERAAKLDLLEMRAERFRRDSLRRETEFALKLARMRPIIRTRFTPAGILALIGFTFGGIIMAAALMLHPASVPPPPVVRTNTPARSGFDTRPTSPIRRKPIRR